jgi:hypothetical protein
VDEDENLISTRDIPTDSLASNIDIDLYGDDLAIQAGETAPLVNRYLVVKATYDSDVGEDLPLNDMAIFPLNNLKYIRKTSS